MSTTRKVNLTEAPSFLEIFASDDFAEIVGSTLLAGDLTLTYFLRYSLLLAQLYNRDATVLPDEGFGVDWTKHNPVHAAFLFIPTALFAFLTFYREYDRQRRRNQRNSYKHIYDAIQKQSSDENEKKNKELAQPDNLDWLNDKDYLQKILDDNPTLSAKYKAICFRNGELHFERKESDAPKSENTLKQPTWYKRWFNVVNNKVIHPTYVMGSVSSYAYWIMWIAVGGFTARFGQGIDGIPLWATFGIPAGIALLYPAIKMMRYGRNQKKQAAKKAEGQNEKDLQEDAQAKEDAVLVLRQALLLRKNNRDKNVFEKELKDLATEGFTAAEVKTDIQGAELKKKDKHEINYLTQDLGARSAMAATSSAFGSFIANQYTTWLATDFLFKVFHFAATTIPIFNIITGLFLIIASVLHGIYKGAQAYSKRKETKKAAEIEMQSLRESAQSLEDIYEQKRKELEKEQKRLGGESLPVKFLEIDHPQFYKEEDRSDTKAWSNTKKISARGTAFFNGFMSGAFLTRVATIAGTGVLPLAALTLSVPWTIILITAGGLVWGIFKTVEYYVKRKEERAQEALKKQVERKKFVEERIRMIDLAMQLLMARDKKVQAQEAKKQTAEQKPVVSASPEPEKEDSNCCAPFARGLLSELGSFAASAGRSLLPGAGAVRGSVSRRP